MNRYAIKYRSNIILLFMLLIFLCAAISLVELVDYSDILDQNHDKSNNMIFYILAAFVLLATSWMIHQMLFGKNTEILVKNGLNFRLRSFCTDLSVHNQPLLAVVQQFNN